VVSFGLEELRRSKGVVKKFHDQGLTLADAHGLLVMSDRRNATCWSTDRHLGLTGVALAV
jgi:hypothetical protein